MRKFGRALMFFMVLLLIVPNAGTAASAAADKTTKYRVYQNDKLLMEFADYKQAEAYARQWSSSHVEEIGTRKWLWHNFPRYQMFQMDVSLPDWKFARLEDAVAEAKNWGYASVRDLQSTGWVWHNYPRYRVYQGEITLNSWEFPTLTAAVAEAQKWGESHIIDLTDNRWVWDNISAARKQELRAGAPVYQVYQGEYTNDDWKFASLEDAINESLKWGNSIVVRIDGKKTVFANLKRFKVYQNDTYLDEFVSLDEAIGYAKQWAHASIRLDGRSIWNNYPTYVVYQNDKPIGEFLNIPDALDMAVQYANASIKNLDGTVIWNNFRKLLFWAWNGEANANTIQAQASATLGLDVDSPSWFQLADADGGLKDTSSKEMVDWLKKQGYEVHPLVNNPFGNAELTSSFLNNPNAQAKFIQTLVDRAAELNVHGINVDFESLSGKDRAVFTEFMRKLTDYAHDKGLKVSVDLPRGSVKWNAQTAFDHEKLAGIVDYIITMTYDQHWSGSTSPGPVAGLNWVEQGVQEFLSYGIPRDKLIMGIPFYVREWTLDANGNIVETRAVYSKNLSSLIASQKAAVTWDESSGLYKTEYVDDNGNRRVFWLENEESVKARLEIAKKYELAGVAAWRLGQEPPEFWKQMLQVK